MDFSGELLIKAGTTESLTLIANISATTTATYFESYIPLAYISSWIDSTGVSSGRDIIETGGSRRLVKIEEANIAFIGGGGGGGGGGNGGGPDPEEPPSEEKLTILLSSQNPDSQEITPPEPGENAIVSDEFLVFEIRNPTSEDVAIEELGVLLEGTAEPSDFGRIVWTDEAGDAIGISYFDTAGNAYRYAKIPDYLNYQSENPLLTIPANSQKIIRIFAFLNSDAPEGGTARFTMRTQEYYIKTVSGIDIEGFPIRGNAMTITKKILKARVKPTGTFETSANPGGELTAVRF